VESLHGWADVAAKIACHIHLETREAREGVTDYNDRTRLQNERPFIARIFVITCIGDGPCRKALKVPRVSRDPTICSVVLEYEVYAQPWLLCAGVSLLDLLDRFVSTPSICAWNSKIVDVVLFA